MSKKKVLRSRGGLFDISVVILALLVCGAVVVGGVRLATWFF